ncbi:MAG: proline--tRNA ligase [Chloroflexota bacterium]
MGNDQFVRNIASREEDYSRWYTDVVLKGELAEWSLVHGCMVIRPYGYTLWENMQQLLDKRFKATGHQNAYFPLLIPESLLAKEAEHVEGFAPEVAWVTHGGQDELEERLAIRPTSEAIIGETYSKWVQSWRDLPILINQWCNVLRWEKVTRLFLRTTEFLWQEGHTVHRTHEEAQEEVMRMLGVYQDFVENELAIPVIPGKKSEQERFKGALETFSIEAMMGDGKALQAGTSHDLGQHFSTVFDIKFQDVDKQTKFAWTTSWGVSTRLIGALIMAHGDEAGLVMPPNVAPYQVVIVPIWRSEEEAAQVREAAASLQRALAGFRVHFDGRDEYKPGWKFNEWELRGVPLRIEIGPRDVAAGQVTLARRDTRAKEAVPLEGVGERVGETLRGIQANLLNRARRFMDANTVSVASFEDLAEAIAERKWVWAAWCGSGTCELAVKEKTAATIRNIPLQRELRPGSCVNCGQPSEGPVIFARAY